MNNYLILVKHSLPDVVENVPAREWHLSIRGRSRAVQLADRLLPYVPELIFSSVEPKAAETAQIIAEKYKLDFHTVENLHEHDRSGVSYLSKDKFQNSVREFFRNPDTLIFGKETANEAHSRFSKAVHSILMMHPKKTIVLVAHGTVISLFISRFTGVSDYILWNELGLPGFVVLDISSNKIVAQENIL